MHFGGAGLAQQLDDALGGGAAHDRIVDDDHALAFDHATHGGQLHAHALFAQFLCGLDEGAGHVLVLDQAHLVGQPGGLRVAGRRGQGGVRHADDHIGLDRGLLRQTRAHALAGGVHVDAVDVGIRTGEVDVFHRADGQLRVVGVLHDPVAVVVDHYDLTGANVAHQFGADHVEGAGLGGEHVGAVLHLAEGERTEAVRIERADHRVLGHEQVGEAAVHGVERFLELVHKGALQGATDEVHQDFGVGVRVEDRALVLQLAAQRRAVRQVAVVAQGHVAVVEAEDERLDVVRGARAGRGVAHVADGPVSLESFDFALVAEHLGEQAESAMAGQMAVIVGDDTGALLTAMLQRVQAEIGESGGVRVAPHAEDATFLVNVFEFSRQAKAPFSNRGLTIRQPYQSAAT